MTTPAWAGDAANGAACHMGGKNVVNATKTLQKGDLEKYDMYDLEHIKSQINKGKAAIPAFANKLTAQEIEYVAAYVLSQADKGW